MDILSYVLGLQAGKASGGGSSRETILSKNTYSFALNSQLGAFANSTASLLFNIEKGKEYIVEWDGTEYKRTAFEFTSADGSSCVALGNPIAAGQASNGDKFAIVTDKTNSYTHFLSLEQTATHSVAIYKEAEISGGGVSFKSVKKTLTITNNQIAWGTRVDVDFGFKPDFLYAYMGSADVATLPSDVGYNRLVTCALGCTEKFANMVGLSSTFNQSFGTSKSYVITSSSTASAIDEPFPTNGGGAFYEADETGFKSPNRWAARETGNTYWYIIAIGIDD